MAGEDPVVAWEVTELIQGLAHIENVAAGEITAAHGAGKQGVAGEHGITHHQAHRAGGIQREDLNAIEVALAYQKLLEVYNLTHEKLSERLGKKRATITNYLRLLKLPAIIQIGLKDKKIEMGHARALAGIEDSQWQLALYDDIVKHGLSVRKVEEIIKTNSPEALARKQSDKQAKKKAQLEYAELQKLLSEKLGTKVKLNIDTKGKGSISIPFKSEKKLEEILACLDRI